MTPLDPDHSERKEKSEGDVDARSERSEQALGDERSDKGDRSEKLDTSEIADRMEAGGGAQKVGGREGGRDGSL
ncbi:hypothetical protein D4764_14G0000610 [Takifugu flavidus]|uniref:Uncharacterized protein n=1 Tax=Takifugu flavidus TaxID=433684 RepID=A0A5C6P776_9TELE|nr:hypothetical protein D4764_14G0000610 [Takifugu flavidus]